MAEGEQQPVLENIITSEQPPATEEIKVEEAGSGALENNSENQEKSKK